MNIKKVLRNIHPKSFVTPKTLIVEFDNKQNFIHWVMQLNLDNTRTDKYVEKFLDDMHTTPSFEGVEDIKNAVRNNLIKRKLIPENIYAGFRYEVDGLILDPTEVALGNPECYLAPVIVGTKYFYELYVNMSVPGNVTNVEIQNSAIKLIETIKLLESRDIQIKINVIDYGIDVVTNTDNYKDILVVIPIASHTDYKDYSVLYPFFSEAMERGALFKVAFEFNDSEDPGSAKILENAINLWDLDEVELAERVIKDLNLPTEL